MSNINNENTTTLNNVLSLDSFRGRSTTSLSDWRDKRVDDVKKIGLGLTSDYPFQGEINPRIINHSIEFIKSQSMLLQNPEIGINADGSILLEWVLKNAYNILTIGSVIFNGNHIIYSIFKDGRVEAKGASDFTDKSIEMIADLLSDYFQRETYDSQSFSR